MLFRSMELLPRMSSTNELPEQVKQHFEDQNSEALMKLLDQGLTSNPENPKSALNIYEPQRIASDQELREEFEIHFENLKNEAIKLFDKEMYPECLGIFEFLCQLDPKDRSLKDYLELCRQLVQQALGDSSNWDKNLQDRKSVV